MTMYVGASQAVKMRHVVWRSSRAVKQIYACNMMENQEGGQDMSEVIDIKFSSVKWVLLRFMLLVLLWIKLL